MGWAPDDTKDSAELQYELEKIHGEQIKHNNDKWCAVHLVRNEELMQKYHVLEK